MKIYLAAMYSLKDTIKKYAKQLEEAGHEVTSGWLRERTDSQVDLYDVSERFSREHAIADLEDIDEADALVLFTVKPIQKTKRGGRHTEFGYALAKHKKLFVIGPRENIFHSLPEIECFMSFEEFLEELNAE